MKPRTWNRVVALACVLLGCFIVAPVKATEEPLDANNHQLSVRESLLPMFSPAFRSSDWFPVYRINPDVRPHILFYLEHDNSNFDYVAGGIWLLGVVGTGSDIEFVDSYIQSCLTGSKEEFRGKVHVLAGASGCFAGMMYKRHIEGAEEFLRKYGNASAWRSSGAVEGVKAYNYFILGAYQYSKADFILPLLRRASSGAHPFLRESALESLESSETDEYTKMMRSRAQSEGRLRKYRMDFLDKNGEWIDMLLRKETLSQWREAQERQRVGPEAERETPVSFESVDISKTVEGASLRVVASDAMEAFQKVSRLLLGGKVGNLPIREEILRSIQESGLNNLSSLQVQAQVEARVNAFVSDIGSDAREDGKGATRPVIVRNKETAAVIFSIQGVTEDEDVTIRMERENGKWHWSPSADPRVDAAAEIVDEKYLIESVRAAVVAYAQISRTLIDGDYDPLIIPVLDNGELIPLEKRKKDRDDMVEALEMEKRVVEELTHSGLNEYGDHRITVRFKGTLSPGQTGAETDIMSLSVRGFETADIRFTIRNGAEAYRKCAPERSGEGCFDDAGGLRVFMKRINGKWYWNPFGW